MELELFDLVPKGRRNLIELFQAFNLRQVPAVIKQSDLNIRQRAPQYFRMFRRDEIVLLAPNYQSRHLHRWKYGIQGIDVSAVLIVGNYQGETGAFSSFFPNARGRFQDIYAFLWWFDMSK